MTGFVLDIKEFVLYMTEFDLNVLNMTGFVLNSREFVLYMTGFVLNMS